MHWADVEAEKIDSNSPLIATGEAPSGPIHLGHIREVLTGETIARVSDGELILIVDSLDPLRRSYPFLDDSYVDHIGKPLSEIPCICGEHDNYAEHFMDPFLRSLEELGVEVKVKYAHGMYARGEYEEAIRSIIEDRDDVAKIIEEETGRELDEDWFPYNPICSGCKEIGNTVIKGFDDPYVEYECECGHEGKSDIRKAEGKLPWRCDWPARWWILGVDCEPFGKDLSASGGCWDTGKRIIEDIFDTEAPHPVVYEWIQLKGEGPMSSSSGVVIKTEEMLQMVSPEVLRFMIMDSKPKSHIDFDPGLGLLDLVDEYDQAEQVYFENGDEDKARAYELSHAEEVPEKRPQRIPYRHLVNLIQIYDDSEKIWEVAQETGQIEEDKEEDYERFEERAENVEFWLENHAPDMVKFSLKEELPSVDLDEDEKTFLRSYSEGLDECEWKGEQLHQLVHEQAEKTGIDKGKAFRSFYKILLGEKRGPRLGRFLSQLEEGFVRERISEAVSS